MRLTKEEHENILKEISDTANFPPETMDLIEKLRNDFDESLIVDSGEVAKDWEEKYNGMVSERDIAIGERDEARRAYRESFFNVEKEAQNIVNRDKEDSPKTLDEVLGIKKGD